MNLLVALAGSAMLHVLGAAATAGLARDRWSTFGGALRSPASLFVALAFLYAVSLELAGVPLLVALLGVALSVRMPGAAHPIDVRVLLVLTAVVLARPLAPTQWDEFVWLGKARLESLGFGESIDGALDPALRLIPTGYPPLWPAAVGWLSLGRDVLSTHVAAASLLVLASAAAALEAWRAHLPEGRLRRALLAVAVLAAPLVWVHARSTYVDLPIGLLGLALLGRCLTAAPGLPAAGLAVALAGFKDDGLAHLLGVAAAVLVLRRSEARRAVVEALAPVGVGLLAVVLWRLTSASHGVASIDHAVQAPELAFLPRLLLLFVKHATDPLSWGVFWAAAGAALVGGKHAALSAVRVALALTLLALLGALLVGPERVRVFAENGTLLNRLLVQLWPLAALGLGLSLAGATVRDPAAPPQGRMRPQVEGARPQLARAHSLERGGFQ